MLAALGAATIFPLLKPVIPGLRIATRVAKEVDSKFFEKAVGPFGSAVKKIFRGNVDEILPWIPALFIIGQIALDSNSREALKFILESARAEEDVKTWVRYLSLPSDGWEGEGYVSTDITFTSEETGSYMDYFIGQANAQPQARHYYLTKS